MSSGLISRGLAVTRPPVRESTERATAELFPADWEVVTLDSVAKRGSGHTPDKEHPEYWGGDIKWISLADSDRLDRVYISETEQTVTPAGIAHSSAVVHPKGTVVLSRDAGIGKSAIMTDDMAVSQHFMAWQCGPHLDSYYLYYWLQSRKSEFERIAAGNTIKTIGLPYFKLLKIPLPLIEEQRAIATVLLDADELINSLDKLVVKKRAIKCSAAHLLLTREVRLPGFCNEWTSFRIEQLARPRLERVDPRKLGTETFCVELDRIEQGTGALSAGVANVPGMSLKCRFQRGDVLFGKLRAYLRKYWLADRSGICSTEIWALAPNIERIAPSFLFQLVQSDRFIQAASTAYGTHMPRSDWKIVRKLEFNIPNLNEQLAIGEALSDMDAEIATIEHRRNKVKALKHTMMQHLLTGRIRLLQPEVVA